MKKTISSRDLRALKEKHGITGARIGVLAGVSPRAVRYWLAPEDNPRHQEIPLSAWRLLRILLGEATPEEIIREAEEKIKTKNNISE
jgi:hypothetical protein